MARPRNAAAKLIDQLRQFGLGYPGAHTKSPWPGHLDLAVNDKTFAYLSAPGEPFSISCKLPGSALAALALGFTEPTGYGLGKSGWVTAKLPEGEELPPAEMFQAWIDESYRAQAPKKLLSRLASGPDAPSAAPKSKSKPAAKPSGAKASAKSPLKAVTKRATRTTKAR